MGGVTFANRGGVKSGFSKCSLLSVPSRLEMTHSTQKTFHSKLASLVLITVTAAKSQAQTGADATQLSFLSR